MLLQAALNGPHGRDHHPAVPITADDIARDAAACVAAGARALHIHPRDGDGRESLAPEVIDSVVVAVRRAVDVPIGVSTGAWIEPDLERRVALVERWQAPDYASVNVSEPGFERVGRALRDAGIGIEAGVWSVDDADRLAASGMPVLRVLVEPLGAAGADIVADIHRALDRHGIEAPRLQHGDGAATWPLLRDAVARGLDTRVGLEDTVHLPDGSIASGNADLVSAAGAPA